MKKVVSKKALVAIFAVVLTALALAAVAWAANTPGNISGGGSFVGPNGIGRIDLNGGGVTDGQIGDPLYYNLNNDLSGNCNGDSGTINVKYGDGTIAAYSILCSHYSNCISMSFYYLDTHLNLFPPGPTYVVVRAINIKPPTGDRIQVGATTSAPLGQDWVNLGFKGSGAQAMGFQFPEQPITAVNWTLTPKPAVCRVRFP